MTYRDNLESLLVVLPQGAADIQAVGLANTNTKQDYKGAFLGFNLNLNLPPPCTTGFFPIQQQRAAAFEDYPEPSERRCLLPDTARLDSTCAARATIRVKPGRASALRRSSCAKATSLRPAQRRL